MPAGKKFKKDRPLKTRINELEAALSQSFLIIKAQESVIKELRPTLSTDDISVKELDELQPKRTPIFTVDTNTTERRNV